MTKRRNSYSKAGAAAQSFWIERTRGTMAEATNQNTENNRNHGLHELEQLTRLMK